MSVNALKTSLSATEASEAFEATDGLQREAFAARVLPQAWTTRYGVEWKRGCVMYAKVDLDRIQNMTLYPDDIFIVTPVKAGTTWTQEIVWHLLNDVDKDAINVMQFYRCPYMELGAFWQLLESDVGEYPADLPQTEESVKQYILHSMEYVERMARPRFIKTHLPLSLLPQRILDTCKVIFVARNVKDLAVSLYHHFQLSAETPIDFRKYATAFKSGNLFFTEVIPMILEAWGQRTHPNMCFLTYEQLKGDFDGCLDRLQSFLGTSLNAEKIEELKREVSLERFRGSSALNKEHEIPRSEKSRTEGKNFIRKGVVGDWEQHFDLETSQEWDEWIRKEFQGSGYDMNVKLQDM